MYADSLNSPFVFDDVGAIATNPDVTAWPRFTPALAFAIALVWAVHPLNSEVVDYVIQRTESLMALFYLGAVYANARTGARPRLWMAAAVACCALGMMCKESMVTAPAMLILYDWIFLADSVSDWAKRWRYHLALCSTWLALAASVLIGGRAHDSAGVGPVTAPGSTF